MVFMRSSLHAENAEDHSMQHTETSSSLISVGSTQTLEEDEDLASSRNLLSPSATEVESQSTWNRYLSCSCFTSMIAWWKSVINHAPSRFHLFLPIFVMIIGGGISVCSLPAVFFNLSKNN